MDFLKMLKSFKFALQGIYALILNENNAKFHFLSTILVVAFSYFLKISTTEWIIILILIGLVWSAEAFNTAIEKMCDFIMPDNHPKIGQIKDLAAAGVLFVSIAALLVACLIFLPKILNY